MEYPFSSISYVTIVTTEKTLNSFLRNIKWNQEDYTIQILLKVKPIFFLKDGGTNKEICDFSEGFATLCSSHLLSIDKQTSSEFITKHVISNPLLKKLEKPTQIELLSTFPTE